MLRNIKKLIPAGGIAALALVFVVSAKPAVAQTSTPLATPTTPPAATTDYVYTATEDLNSLTLMARQAVTKAISSDTKALSNAGRVYAETNISNELGARFLMLGEQITIPKASVDKFIASGKTLSEADTAAWNAYLPLVSFDPITTTATPVATTPPASPDSTTVTPESSTVTPTTSTTTNDTKKSGTPWYWWVLGIATLAGLYYILGGKPSKE